MSHTRRVSLCCTSCGSARRFSHWTFSVQTIHERFSEGASGAFMCESHDRQFVIKSMAQVWQPHRSTLTVCSNLCLLLSLKQKCCAGCSRFTKGISNATPSRFCASSSRASLSDYTARQFSLSYVLLREQCSSKRNTWFVGARQVMKNVFCTANTIHERYDLKVVPARSASLPCECADALWAW